MKVSVILTTFNRPDTVRWSIQSVRRQTYPVELIAVDGGTDVNVRHSLNIFGVPTIVAEGSTISEARNLGFKKSTGNAVIFLDDDNWIEPTYVEKTLNLMTPGVAIVTTDMHVFSADKDSIVKAENVSYNDMLERNRIHSSSLVSANALVHVGGFKENVYEDWELWLNILSHGWGVRVVNEPLFHYRHAESSLITRLQEKHDIRMQNMRKLYR